MRITKARKDENTKKPKGFSRIGHVGNANQHGRMKMRTKPRQFFYRVFVLSSFRDSVF
jgi:hypothetical protein